jgi:MFS family permease
MGAGWPEIDPALFGALVAILVITGLVFGIILMYISSVMRFILFDSVMAKECHIREGWSRRQGPGWRYFLWKLVYLLVTLATLIVLVGIPLGFAFAVGWLRDPKEHVLPLVLGGVVLFFVLLIIFVLLAVIFVLTKDFVIPQMALENIGAFEGWRRLWPVIDAEKGAFAGYIGMKILMAIGAGIVVGIATLILGLFIAIPTIGLSILAVLTGKTAGLTWNVYTITLAVVVGSILLAIFLYLVALISVPVIVFFPAYSIYFFAARYPALSRALYPAPPVPLAPQTSPGAPPPYEPPALPPAPEPIR